MLIQDNVTIVYIGDHEDDYQEIVDWLTTNAIDTLPWVVDQGVRAFFYNRQQYAKFELAFDLVSDKGDQ